ncbi:MAG: hypothetical protein KJ607_09420, partial [Bacteroidetes bacterium]|nr:hypothetical protein [Bacteroidota bacterium]
MHPIRIIPSKVIILLFLFTITYCMFNIKRWNKTDGVIGSDIVSYYSYLPAIFIYKDPGLSFLDNPPAERGIYWPGKAPNG